MFVLDYITEGDVCAEVGVWRGMFSRHILSKNPSVFYGIDPWTHFPQFGNRCYGKRKGTNQELLDNIYQQAIDNIGSDSRVSLHRMMSAHAAQIMPNNHLDFLYIDGNHSFEYVLADLIAFIPKMKQGGIICGDDYTFNRCKRGAAKAAVKILTEAKIIKLINTSGNQFVLEILDFETDPLDHLNDDLREEIESILDFKIFV